MKSDKNFKHPGILSRNLKKKKKKREFSKLWSAQFIKNCYSDKS